MENFLKATDDDDDDDYISLYKPLILISPAKVLAYCLQMFTDYVIVKTNTFFTGKRETPLQKLHHAINATARA
ncbi:hypothetical protein T4B_12046 [Trichinella pseudospiralis]|uniref:Uncharacterized protein n=1 Tax=Trichinella pseudospiralis TaxID=6337 RepID=A0A0V1IS93_TRIPS|nr:hypothetical protein T4B_12046 [Trichinella pseudospiralis]